MAVSSAYGDPRGRVKGNSRPRMCRSTNRPSVAEPEVYFRIVHVSLQGQNGALWPPTANRRSRSPWAQGGLRKRQHRYPDTPCARRPSSQRRPAAPGQAQAALGAPDAPGGRTHAEGPRVAVTQVLGLLRLAAEIQEHILSMPEMVGRPVVSERALRPISQIENTREQADRFQKLLTLSTS